MNRQGGRHIKVFTEVCMNYMHTLHTTTTYGYTTTYLPMYLPTYPSMRSLPRLPSGPTFPPLRHSASSDTRFPSSFLFLVNFPLPLPKPHIPGTNPPPPP
ncbi:hypothetical protein LX32DRAFT_51407 [Colletotrichum zoysiae]|uniref:Uncharacterized protein n=1 Tax=Colletotrichum zoysiae TaxID=1216348 RepID=A0AAD9HAS2_9PEZI|nr:hypothetical protein LX32DRAFT_51407 [Colletotrichum zoysiae]